MDSAYFHLTRKVVNKYEERMKKWKTCKSYLTKETIVSEEQFILELI